MTLDGTGVAGRTTSSRPARYALVSVVAGGLAQAGLLVAYAGFGWSTTAASIFSLAVSIGPSYWGSRTYVWPAHGPARRSEALSFVVVAVLGTLAAIVLTAATHYVGQMITHNLAVLSAFVTAGSVLATVVVWLARYFVLDRIVFASRA